MFDTYVTVVGNVLHEPEQRQLPTTGAKVTTFKIASTARRIDRQTGKWIDGNSLRVRVTCWRALGVNVKQSVQVGDPLVVYGRLFTRDWRDDAGNKRLAYELEAASIGHDLSRGRAFFERARTNTTTSATEDADAEQRVGGEMTEPVPDSEADQFDDTPFGAMFDQPAAAPEGPWGPDTPFGGEPGAGSAPVDAAGLQDVAGPVDTGPMEAGPVDAAPSGVTRPEVAAGSADTAPSEPTSGPAAADPESSSEASTGAEAFTGAESSTDAGSGRRRNLRRTRVPA